MVAQADAAYSAVSRVQGLHILGRGDVIKKRSHDPPPGSVETKLVAGWWGVTADLAQKMRRSQIYDVREDRTTIVCQSVDAYRANILQQ